MSAPIYDIAIKSIDGRDTTVGEYAGKAILVVNVASKCGLTPHYKGLEALYRKYKDQGLVILGFPCNQFGSQEPGTEQEIQSFCSLNYDVSFPMFAKIDVNGANTHPLYQHLKKEEPGILGIEAIKWNFTKFLVGRNGDVIKRYAPTTSPEDIDADVAKALS